MHTQGHRYIVIEGPIGVGKTSLARRLCTTLAAQPILEQASENPFLAPFYQNRRRGALPAQLYFLLQRAQQLTELNQADLFAPVRVADYLLDKDRLFARLTLDDEEFALYEQLYSRLALEPPRPDLVVYLQAPVDVLLTRIRRRGIAYEQSIDAAYLERLNEAYAGFFHDYRSSPLLVVDASSIDPVSNEADYQDLLSAILATKTGRAHYNGLRPRQALS